jgi:hypothetical protein
MSQGTGGSVAKTSVGGYWPEMENGNVRWLALMDKVKRYVRKMSKGTFRNTENNFYSLYIYSLQDLIHRGDITLPPELDQLVTTMKIDFADLIFILTSAAGCFDVFDDSLQSSIHNKSLSDNITTTVQNVFLFCDDPTGSITEESSQDGQHSSGTSGIGIPTPSVIAGQLENESGQQLLHAKWRKLPFESNPNCASLFMGYVVAKDFGKPGFHVSPSSCPAHVTIRMTNVARIFNHENLNRAGNKGILGTLYGLDEARSASTINVTNYLLWPNSLSCDAEDATMKGHVSVNMALRECGIKKKAESMTSIRATPIKKEHAMIFIDIMQQVRRCNAIVAN